MMDPMVTKPQELLPHLLSTLFEADTYLPITRIWTWAFNSYGVTTWESLGYALDKWDLESRLTKHLDNHLPAASGSGTQVLVVSIIVRNSTVS